MPVWSDGYIFAPSHFLFYGIFPLEVNAVPPNLPHCRPRQLSFPSLPQGGHLSITSTLLQLWKGMVLVLGILFL